MQQLVWTATLHAAAHLSMRAGVKTLKGGGVLSATQGKAGGALSATQGSLEQIRENLEEIRGIAVQSEGSGGVTGSAGTARGSENGERTMSAGMARSAMRAVGKSVSAAETVGMRIPEIGSEARTIGAGRVVGSACAAIRRVLLWSSLLPQVCWSGCAVA